MGKILKESDYEGLDKSFWYSDFRLARIHEYNKKYGSNYKFISQFIINLYSEGIKVPKIADFLEMSVDGVYVALNRMDIKRTGPGGVNNYCNLSSDAIVHIRESIDTQAKIAKLHGISRQTVRNVRNKVGRWANL